MLPKKIPIGKLVEIKCFGQSYRGLLKSVSDQELYLQTPQKRVALSIDQIRDIRELDPQDSEQLLKLMGLKK